MNKLKNDKSQHSQWRERQERINNIALFFLFPLIFFLSHLYFLSDNIVLGMPANVWLLAVACYYVFFVSYHLWHKIFPYHGELRYLAFIDILCLAFLISLSHKGYFFWILLYIQANAIIIGIKLCDEFPKYFTISYVMSLFMLCFITGYWESDHQLGGTVLIAGIRFSGLGIMILISWYGSNSILNYFNEKAELKTLAMLEERVRDYANIQHKNNKVTAGIAKQESHSAYQQALFYAYQQHHKNYQQPAQELWQFQEDLFFELQSVVYSKRSRERLIYKYKEKIKIEAQLKHYFEKSLALYFFHNELSEEERDRLCQNAEIHTLETTPKKITVTLPPILFWMLYQWFVYYFKQATSSLQIILSYHNQQLTIKGVATLATKDTGYYAQGVTCPTCQKNVRTLYQYSYSESGFHCSQCLKEYFEKNLRQDWENTKTPKTKDESCLWLGKYLLQHYQIGNVQYGIQNWDNREYFISLAINDFVKKETQEE